MDQHDRMYHWLMNQVEPSCSDWMSKSVIKETVTSEVLDMLRLLHDETLLSLVVEHCPIHGAKPKDYLPRFMTFPDGLQAVATIRFRNRDVNFPFVRLLAQNREFGCNEETDSTLDRINTEFALFKPQWCDFYHSAHHNYQPRHLIPKKRLVAGPTRFILENFRAVTLAPLTLQRSAVSELYPAYADCYAAVITADPTRKPFARPETESDLTEAERSDCLLAFAHKGAFAGLVAFSMTDTLGLRGASVLEMVLRPDLHGRGWGAWMQATAIRQLVQSHPHCSVIFGTIHSQNESALRTAFKLGRKDLGGYFARQPQVAPQP